jgi:Bacterial pre-peptidase C-terminal domain
MRKLKDVGQALPPANRWFHSFVLLCVLATTAAADTRYMVDYVLPRGGGRGASVEVEFHGAFLENPKEIVFYQPGIQASGFAPYAKAGDGFKVRFQIAVDCPLGEHVLRVRTATALSDAVTFWVSPFQTVYEFEDKVGQNDTIASAKPVPLNSTVEGQILPGPDADIDVYRIEVKEGQRISVEVEAARLGTLHNGGENDLAVRILDAAGKVLGRNDDSALYVQDPVLSLLAPRTGTYFIEIRQQVYYPPRQAYYRAHIGTFSRPTAIYPAGGQAGTSITARVLGDPAGPRTVEIALPKKAGNFAYFGDAPSANVLRVSPYPNVLWSEEPAIPVAIPGAIPVTCPAALNGILDKPGTVHTFRLALKKGENWKVQVFARTLGAPVDPRIWIRAVNGQKNLLEADDARLVDLGKPSSRGTWYIKDQQDPVAVFKVPADGEYLIGIEDATGAGGADHVYRVEIEAARDTIYTHITMSEGYQMPRLTGLVVPRGNRWTLDVQLAQGLGNNYKGDLELEAVGLPAGVTMIAPRVTKGMNRVPVQFVATAEVQPQAALMEILARPVDQGIALDSGSRQGFALTNRGGELPWHFVFLNKYAMAVTEPAPFRVTLAAPPIALMQGSELLLKATVEREKGFDGAIEIQTDWLPSGVSKEPAVTIPAGKSEATFKIQANDKAAAGTYRIAMNATTTGGDAYSGIGRVRVSSEFVDLKIAEPYLSIELTRTSVERGKRGEIMGTLKVNRAFEGKATVKLRQLPRGVKMLEPAPEITAKDTRVVFRIEADADALTGLNKGIACEVTFTEAGQTVHATTGNGILRVDLPRASL